jgi:FkbM family methyltransferase
MTPQTSVPAPPFWKRVLLRSFQTVIVLGTVFIVLSLAVWAYPPLIILATPGHVSSPYCTKWQTVLESNVLVDQRHFEERIRKASHLVQRDGPLELWETPNGRFWIPTDKSDSHTVLHLLLAQQERNIYGGPKNGVRRGDVVFDLGAHVGVYVRKALDAGASKVIAVEPTPEVVECLRRNFPAEIVSGRVIVVPKGIWDKDDVLDLFGGGVAGSGNTFINETGQTAAKSIQGIPVTSIDRLVEELKLERVDFIKADIKGAVTRMLKGGSATIHRFHPRMVFSTEEPPEEPNAINDALLAIAPDYKLTCGPCLLSGGEIRNDVIFFQ